MAEPQLLGRMYQAIITGMVRDGWAPHYTELAAALGLSSDEARQALHELDGRGVPGFWVRSGTDLVESCAPFSNIPTQYHITVEGHQKWYGQ
jgi:Mn-dependent DtxR family transcriptional regulator